MYHSPGYPPQRVRVLPASMSNALRPNQQSVAYAGIAAMDVQTTAPQQHYQRYLVYTQNETSLILYALCLCLLLVVVSPTLFATSPTKPVTSSALAQPSRTLVRLNQWDTFQYNTVKDARMWGPSGCSAAAMTEILNYYSGRGYRIADILSVEEALGEITPQLGMLHGASSIGRTVAHFGFSAGTLSAPTVDEVIRRADGDEPVIVGFPPSTWSGGHVLIVRGGNAKAVYLVDSSRLNMPSMTRKAFLSYWRGFAVVLHTL